MQYGNNRLDQINHAVAIIARQALKMGVAPKDIPSLYEWNLYTNRPVTVPSGPFWLDKDKHDLRYALTTRYDLVEAKTIIFDSAQIEVFRKLHTRYNESLDYILPFRRVYIQFTKSLPLVLEKYSCLFTGMVLSQVPVDENGEAVDIDLREISDNTPVVNTVTALTWSEKAGFAAYRIAWQSTTRDEWLGDYVMADAFKSLAIACIGYINCENIYLHQEGIVPDKVNRKREREGKKILEPYYVCRIRGVQYDSNGEPTGEGTHHGFRYDVRGHFRRLDSGRTTWVRPHQRGLQHELYVPKTYVVEKGAKRLEPTV